MFSSAFATLAVTFPTVVAIAFAAVTVRRWAIGGYVPFFIAFATHSAHASVFKHGSVALNCEEIRGWLGHL